MVGLQIGGVSGLSRPAGDTGSRRREPRLDTRAIGSGGRHRRHAAVLRRSRTCHPAISVGRHARQRSLSGDRQDPEGHRDPSGQRVEHLLLALPAADRGGIGHAREPLALPGSGPRRGRAPGAEDAGEPAEGVAEERVGAHQSRYGAVEAEPAAAADAGRDRQRRSVLGQRANPAGLTDLWHRGSIGLGPHPAEWPIDRNPCRLPRDDDVCGNGRRTANCW